MFFFLTHFTQIMKGLNRIVYKSWLEGEEGERGNAIFINDHRKAYFALL